MFPLVVIVTGLLYIYLLALKFTLVLLWPLKQDKELVVVVLSVRVGVEEANTHYITMFKPCIQLLSRFLLFETHAHVEA